MRCATGPTSSATRSFISPAALLVNVIARISNGDTSRSAMRYATRWVSRRVLPEPAPAMTSTGPSGAITASRWTGFSPATRSSLTRPKPVSAVAASQVNRTGVRPGKAGSRVGGGRDPQLRGGDVVPARRPLVRRRRASSRNARSSRVPSSLSVTVNAPVASSISSAKYCSQSASSAGASASAPRGNRRNRFRSVSKSQMLWEDSMRSRARQATGSVPRTAE